MYTGAERSLVSTRTLTQGLTSELLRPDILINSLTSGDLISLTKKSKINSSQPESITPCPRIKVSFNGGHPLWCSLPEQKRKHFYSNMLTAKFYEHKE